MKVAILGASYGGLYLLADFGRLGLQPTICDTNPERLKALEAQGGVEVVGEGLARFAHLTTDPVDAAKGAELVIVCTGGRGQEAAATTLAPHLKDGQIILLISGNTGGSLVVRRALDQAGCTARVLLAEMDNYPSAYWLRAPAKVEFITSKKWLQVATLPSQDIDKVLPVLSSLIPGVVPASSIFATGLCNMNAVLHVANCAVNAGMIDRGDRHLFYGEGVTPIVERMYGLVSDECRAIGRELGVEVPTLARWYEKCYGISSTSLVDMFKTLSSAPDGPYQPTRSPVSFESGYLAEDVPCGLVPISALGAAVGVATPTIDLLIAFVAMITANAYEKDYRDAARMGISGQSAAGLRALAERGFH
ncbi:NAD/NADP octopine/nopaline dehydrogenase family protein [Pseudooceanicola pacificus]|nr:NAD/NADP octopine/nopaline dehydrogenase family protein [Pseudooceanicola pacificus]